MHLVLCFHPGVVGCNFTKSKQFSGYEGEGIESLLFSLKNTIFVTRHLY